jgi:glycosyltransferase involved in cell wall biosynthesis
MPTKPSLTTASTHPAGRAGSASSDQAWAEPLPDPTHGCRVVIDLRPLQMPARAPVTAHYLGGLLAAYAAEPLEGESFVALLQTGLPDPTEELTDLPIAGRRWVPPTSALRAGALTLDPFLLRGLSVAAGRGASRGAVYHLAGTRMPLGSRLPVVATLLDLAPWELPHIFRASPAANFGERLRARMLQRASAVIVGTEAVARSAQRLLHLRPDRLHVIPLVAHPAMTAARDGAKALEAAVSAERRRLGLPDRYLVFSGRYDARTDLPTLFDALELLSQRPRPKGLDEKVAWPPQVVLAAARPDDVAALARAAARRDLAQHLTYAPDLPSGRLATVIAGARAALVPASSDAAGLAAIDAIACGTPVIASSVGAMPEIVAATGVLVEPRDPARLARAIEAVWSDDTLHRALREAADGPGRPQATWSEVARLTRAVYASVVAARARR